MNQGNQQQQDRQGRSDSAVSPDGAWNFSWKLPKRMCRGIRPRAWMGLHTSGTHDCTNSIEVIVNGAPFDFKNIVIRYLDNAAIN